MNSISPALRTSWTAAVVVPYMLPEMSLGPELQNVKDFEIRVKNWWKNWKSRHFNKGWIPHLLQVKMSNLSTLICFYLLMAIILTSLTVVKMKMKMKIFTPSRVRKCVNGLSSKFLHIVPAPINVQNIDIFYKFCTCFVHNILKYFSDLMIINLFEMYNILNKFKTYVLRKIT